MTDAAKTIHPIIRNSALAMRRARSGRAMPGRAASASSRPMSEMNVTPFIDVLLVLLIMIIMAVPAVMHKTEVPLPTGVGEPIDSVSNTVFISEAGQLFWNGEPTSRVKLRNTVLHMSALPEQPQLRFEPSPKASYDTSVRTIALIKEAGAEKFAFIGNHQHRDFGR